MNIHPPPQSFDPAEITLLTQNCSKELVYLFQPMRPSLIIRHFWRHSIHKQFLAEIIEFDFVLSKQNLN